MSSFYSENLIKNIGFLVLDGIVYAFLGTIILVIVTELQSWINIDTIKEFLGIKPKVAMAICHYGFVGLGGIWILPSLFISHLAGNAIFEKTTQLFSRKWIFIITYSSILPIILATTFLPFITDLPINIDVNLIFWFFFALLPFTFLYAKFPLLVKKFIKTNSLK